MGSIFVYNDVCEWLANVRQLWYDIPDLKERGKKYDFCRIC